MEHSNYIRKTDKNKVQRHSSTDEEAAATQTKETDPTAEILDAVVGVKRSIRRMCYCLTVMAAIILVVWCIVLGLMIHFMFFSDDDSIKTFLSKKMLKKLPSFMDQKKDFQIDFGKVSENFGKVLDFGK